MPLCGKVISELCPAAPDRKAKYFKEIFVSDCFQIPTQKPNAEQIITVSRTFTLEDVETIKVELPPHDPCCPCLQIVGNKIFITGNVYLGLQYTALVPEQNVHFARFQLPFETFIVQDCGNLIPLDDPIFTNGYVVHICVERMKKELINERTVCVDLLLLVWIEELPQP